MKKAYIYLTFIVIAVLAVACSKNGSQVDPTKPEAAKEANIGFGTASAKAPDALVKDENKPLQVRVYDYYTATTTETVYINDLIQEATTAGAWAFVSGDEYAWKKGAHKFLGWVEKDETGANVPNLSYANKVLSVGTAAAPVAAADYRYAEIVTVNWPDNTMIGTDASGKSVAKPVSLNVKHLTSALKLKVKNSTNANQTVAITSATLKNVVTTGSAKVDYSAESVAYTAGATGNITLPAVTISGAMAPDAEVVSDMVYVWPQEVNPAPAEGETPATVATVEVAYTLNGAEKTAKMDIPATEWEAGKVYILDLQIVNKNIVLVFKVQPWDASEEAGEIDTSTGSINMTNVTWMNTVVRETADGPEVNTLNNSGYAVTMYYHPYVKNGDSWTQYTANNGYIPAQGYFTVNYPKEGLFKIELIPAYGETEVSPEFYEIYIYEYPTKKEVDGVEVEVPGFFRPIDPDGEEISMNTVYFQVRAAGPKDAQGEEGDDDYVPAFDGQDGAQHKAQINIWFKPDDQDEWISAYSEIRANYALIIPATS
ncbi:MAG: hypothetical protein IJL42_04360 [Bacteroidales bacterium]|nr:hypothetical protein [Bacteroidales bacterium]